MPQVSLSASLNYTAPGGGTINTDIVAVGSYLASSLGTLDVPSGSSSGATFALPLGGVGNPCAFYVKSSIGTSAILKLNGGSTGMPLTDGGVMLYGNPKTPASTTGPLAAIAIQLTAAQTAYGSVDYVIFGD
jgi:hypothetical protein